MAAPCGAARCKGNTAIVRGFFGIGIEGVSKPMNFGNLARTAYGFGAAFVFTVAPTPRLDAPPSDTAGSANHLPWYSYESVAAMRLPDNCTLVGVELTDEAVELPSFRHPAGAAYLLGPEGGSLSPAALDACAHVVRIPTLFCLNVATAGAIVMYDRVLNLGRFAERPLHVGGQPVAREPVPHGWGRWSGGVRQPGAKGRDRTGRAGKRLGEE